MQLTDWHWLLSRTRTHEALLELCNEYLESVRPMDLALLPRECRPTRMQAPEDIAHWVNVLSDRLCMSTGDARADAVLGDILAFLFSAYDRSQEIHGAAPANDASMGTQTSRDTLGC